MTDINLTGTPGTPGVNGVNGSTPGEAGTDGGPGGNAAPAQNTGNGIDTLNTEEATGGGGGVGGNGGSSSGTGGNAGAGGNGGNATASTSTTLNSIAGITSTATATGGAGGHSGIPGNYYPGYSYRDGQFGQWANGGDGGTATASAASADSTGVARATATATGGYGGAASGFFGVGGAGGIASNTTASASGFSAYATANQTGGAGGGTLARLFSNGGAGAGASSTLTNAVSGTTTGGTLGLYQTATGGAGGNAAYASSQGGIATSSLTFNDVTANTTHATTLIGYSTATGGAGGGYYGGVGGAATAAIALTGAHTVTATSTATGGQGGDFYGTRFLVGGATATAMATTGSTTEAATAHAKATTANGQLATANATATGATGSDDSTAVTHGSTSRGSMGDGAVTTVSAFAQAPVGGTATTLAETSSDNQLGSSGFNGTNDNSYAFATEVPNSSLVTDILNANSNLETALGSGTVFGLATEGASYSTTASGSRTYTDTIAWNLDTTGLSGDLIAGLINDQSFGSGFESLDFNVVENGTTIFDRKFATLSDAQTFFTNDALDLRTLPIGPNQTIDFNFSLATSASGAGFGAQFLLGTTSTSPALTGQVVLNAATEGVTLPDTTQVATFTDTNTSDTSSTFKATINWGDGSTSTGTVSGSNGKFTVSGGHTYADEGSFPLGVTITDTANNTSLPLSSGTVAVAEADVLTANGLTFTANSGQAFSGTVATFTDSDTSNVASDFNATINWGDGTTTAGAITDTAGTISVSGTHTYTTTGQQAVSVTLSDDAPGTATATASSTADVVGLAGQTSLTVAKEGVALPDTTEVATFTGPNTSDTASSFTATINWGDGTTTTGVVSGSNGAFTVTGGHTYADEGSFPLGVTITDTANNTSVPLSSGTVTAAEADVLTAHGLTFIANPGQAFSGTVATFTDSDTSNVASDFNATINWGDGTSTAGVITDTAGVISVSGTHTYGLAGQKSVFVTLSDDAPGTATATASSTADVAGVAGLAGQTRLTAAKEGVALPSTTKVATFTDTNRSDKASSFTATINWGDGTTTSGRVTGSNGAFTVTGGHRYAGEGSFPLGVTITDKANSTSLPLSGTVAVAETDVLSARGLTFRANAGHAFTGKVATFTDRNTGNVAGDFSATINWGDGTTTPGVITDTRGTISVSGTHTYASSGRDAVTVTLTDGAPGTATATAHSTATVTGTTTALAASANSAGSSGALTVSDGQHAQSLALLGQYMASSFVTTSDGHDSTLITVPPPDQQSLLSHPHAQ